jgi:hypothetical protein
MQLLVILFDFILHFYNLQFFIIIYFLLFLHGQRVSSIFRWKLNVISLAGFTAAAKDRSVQTNRTKYFIMKY